MSKQDRNEGKSGISDLTVIALVTSVLLPLVGWILGFKARKQIVESEGRYVGRPFATAAIWIGGIITVGWVGMVGLLILGSAVSNDGRFDGMGRGDMGQGRMHRGFANYAPHNPNGFDQGRPGMPGNPDMMNPQDPNSTTNP
jgi:hypothetical protein